MKKKYPPWYRSTGLKPITGFLTAAEKIKLRRLALSADKSLSRYVTRILQNHIWEMDAAATTKTEIEKAKRN